MPSPQYYAYFLPEEDLSGITDDWSECERIVSGKKNARYRGFKTRKEAEEWLEKGAGYDFIEESEPGIYFDAGTGRGKGVEVSVTDEKGNSLLHKILSKKEINRFGKYNLKKDYSNNYGELLACKFALEIALKTGAKKVFGDSKLIINYWSQGFVKEVNVTEETLKLIDLVQSLREKFKRKGGAVITVTGKENPADLGFHR